MSITTSPYVRQLASVSDMFNNIGRVGCIDDEGRVWKAVEAFSDDDHNCYYLMQHMNNEEQRVIVPINRIHNFY